ncbi:MAG TPA: SRPBCC domain-containing protein [Candidatus Paceibacterota bacterium]|nr:SRPBCC domain-containing protein [Candidatus Paceibacterota bacterium]
MNTTATIKDNNIKLQLTRVFDAPRELVFKAWTDANQFKQWFGAAACDGASLQSVKVDARTGGKYRLQVRRADGEFFTTVGTYREVRPPERLVFTWQFEKDGSGDEFGEVEPPEMLVTVEFKARGRQTELTLTHEKFASVESRDRHEDGWNRCLEQLAEIATSTADREIVISREFNVPRELVWEAMTNPKHVVNWWGPRGFSMTIEEMDFRVGGDWKHVMQGPDGVNYPNHSVFKEIMRPERIVFSHGGKREGGPGVGFVSTWSFENRAADKTRVTIRMVFPSAAERDFVVKEFGAIEGGKQTLERLAEYLPKIKPAPTA